MPRADFDHVMSACMSGSVFRSVFVFVSVTVSVSGRILLFHLPAHMIHARKGEERIKVVWDPATEMDTGNQQPQGVCDTISKVEVLSTRNYIVNTYMCIYCYYYRDTNADD